MTANAMPFDIATLDSREHAARVLTDARRRQLELATEGRMEESAAYAQMAATIRALLDELEIIEQEPRDFLTQRREMVVARRR